MKPTLRWFVLGLCLVMPAVSEAGGVRFVEKEDTPEQSTSVAVSPDGAHLYVVGQHDSTVSVHSLDSNGHITLLDTYATDADTAGVAVSGDGAHVYVTTRGSGGGGSNGEVVVYSRDANSMSANFGKLTEIQTLSDPVDVPLATMRKPQAVAVSPVDFAHVYVVTAGSKSIVAFSRDTDPMSATFGKLAFLEVQQQTPGSCDTMLGICGLNNARYLAFSADGKSVYAAGNKGDTTAGTVAVFARNVDDMSADYGKLTFKQAVRNLENGITDLHHPSAIVVSGDGDHVYVTSPGGKSVHAFARNSGDGTLTQVAFYKDGGGTPGLNGASGIAMDSPAGSYVYVTAAADGALSVFRRDPTTGKLAILETHFNVPDLSLPGLHDLINPQDAAVSPDGKHLYVASTAARVVSFDIDQCGDAIRGTDQQCDDGNASNGDGCSSTCQLELCNTIMTGCTTVHTAPVEQAYLSLRNDALDDKDQLQWKWAKAPVAQGAYGDPRATATYVLCVYDSNGMVTQPLMNSAAPHGNNDDCKSGDKCWKTSPSPSSTTPHVPVGSVTQFKYADKSMTPNGIKQVQMKTGTTSASIKVKGKGINVRAPGLPLDPPVTVMLKNTENNDCWQAVYDTAPVPTRIIKNDGSQFKAKSN